MAICSACGMPIQRYQGGKIKVFCYKCTENWKKLGERLKQPEEYHRPVIRVEDDFVDDEPTEC